MLNICKTFRNLAQFLGHTRDLYIQCIVKLQGVLKNLCSRFFATFLWLKTLTNIIYGWDPKYRKHLCDITLPASFVEKCLLFKILCQGNWPRSLTSAIDLSKGAGMLANQNWIPHFKNCRYRTTTSSFLRQTRIWNCIFAKLRPYSSQSNWIEAWD